MADVPSGLLRTIRELARFVSPARRRQFVPVLLLMLAGAVAELVSIGAILPFLAVVANPATITGSRYGTVLHSFGIETFTELIVATAALFALSAILAGAVRLLLVWVSQNFIFGVAKELGVAVYDRTLHQPYAYHVGRNSSETLAAINKAQLVTGGALLPLMQATTAGVLAIFILAGLIYIDPLVALATGAGFTAIYLGVMTATRRVMRRNGGIIAAAQGERLQAAGEGLGGIRDVLLDRSQHVFLERFNVVEGRLRQAQATNNFIAQAPRFVVEGLGVVLIAALALALSFREGGFLEAIPLLGALALGAQRLMPLLQQIYSGWSQYMTNGRMLGDILDILNLPAAPEFALPPPSRPLPFEREIVLDGVSFRYPSGNRAAVQDISITIPKSARVGIVGKTGSGKSTLMDLVLGLLKPTEGRILVDGVELTDANRSAWQAQIAHVPQAIYLADASVAENIAFGVPKGGIDMVRVREAAREAEIAGVIDALPERYDTFVGERGIRLSGGQRQRIGIARALYKRASVLVLDEATSALDYDTEDAIINSLNKLSEITIFSVAHRSSALQNCDIIIERNLSTTIGRQLT